MYSKSPSAENVRPDTLTKDASSLEIFAADLCLQDLMSSMAAAGSLPSLEQIALIHSSHSSNPSGRPHTKSVPKVSFQNSTVLSPYSS